MSIKEELRIEILDTRRAFHALLAEIPDEALSGPSDNPAWTIGEVLFHMEYPGYDPLLGGEVTLERLFRYIKLHFEAHAVQIRKRLAETLV